MLDDSVCAKIIIVQANKPPLVKKVESPMVANDYSYCSKIT